MSSLFALCTLLLTFTFAPLISGAVLGFNEESPLSILVDTLWWQNNRGRNIERIMKMGHDNGVSIDLQNEQGWSPLSFAVAYNSPNAVNVFLQYGANVNEAENDGWTPLHFAAFHGLDDIATTLLSKGADPTLRNRALLLPSSLARNEGHLALAARLAEATYASSEITVDANSDLELLMDCIRDTQGHPNSAVHPNMVLSYSSGHTPLTLAASLGDANVARELLEMGANARYANARTGETALHYAVNFGGTEPVRVLLEHCGQKGEVGDEPGPNAATVTDNAGASPLSLAEAQMKAAPSGIFADIESQAMKEARITIVEALQKHARVETETDKAERKVREAQEEEGRKKREAAKKKRTFLSP